MRFDGKDTRQRADNISITKLSVVKKPAHQDALASIIKSAAVTEEDIEKQTFMDALQQINIEEQMEEFFDTTWDLMWALRRSIRDTMDDSEIENKKEVIQNNISDFAAAMSGVVSATNIIKRGETDMKKEEIDAMIKDAVDPLQAKLTTAEAVAKMDDSTKAYYKSLDDEGREAFIKMSADDQQAAIKVHNDAITAKSNDETLTVDGNTIAKSDVGSGVFNILKSQQTEIDSANDRIAKAKVQQQEQEFAKQAEGLYANLPGDPVKKGKVLKALHDLDPDTRDCALGMLKAGNKGIEDAGMFKEYGQDGHVDPVSDSPTGKLNKMAEDYAKANTVSFAKAYDAVLQTSEGQELYEKSLEQK